jgi:hypothetical protein
MARQGKRAWLGEKGNGDIGTRRDGLEIHAIYFVRARRGFPVDAE